jgi:cysteine/glycine-rich protein
LFVFAKLIIKSSSSIMSGFHAAAAPKCAICDKSVYKMEEIVALGHTWHKDCFKCGGCNADGCKKKLTLDSYTEHQGQPYCKPCYGSLFGPRGYMGGSATVHSYAGDAGVAAQPVNADSAHTPALTPPAAGAVPEHAVHSAVTHHETSHAHASSAATGPKCAICSHTVYKMEEIVALGTTFHKDCFTCGGHNADGCKKKLTLDSYTEHQGEPYCRTCHSKNFGPRGYMGGAGGVAVHSYEGDAGVAGAAEGVANLHVAGHHDAGAGAHGADVHAAVAAHNTTHAAGTGGAAKHFGTPAPKCEICEKSVFKMEEVVALGHTFHKDCFKCGGSNADGCKKRLNLDSYTEHTGQPYCKTCYAGLFGPRGYMAGSATVHTFAGDAGVSTATADEHN